MTLEAIIAIVIIFLFIYSVININQRGIGKEENVKEKMDFILKGISLNEEYRNCIVRGGMDKLGNCKYKTDKTEVEVDIGKFIGENLGDYNYEICVGAACSGPESMKDIKSIYVSSIFVSAVLETKGEKEVYLYVWER